MTDIKIPRGRRAHRASSSSTEWAPNTVAGMLGTPVPSNPTPRHRKLDPAQLDDTVVLRPVHVEPATEIVPIVGVLDDLVAERISQLRQLGGVIVVSDPDFLSVLCGLCCRGRMTCVTVVGQPHGDDLVDPITTVDACFECAPVVIRQARIEQNPHSDIDIRVEVAGSVTAAAELAKAGA